MVHRISSVLNIAFLQGIFLLSAVSVTAQTFEGDTGIITDDGLLNYYNLQVSGVSPDVINTAFGLVTVCIDATHTWDDDLVIWLKAP
ncbi:MAG: hypothetical protein ABIO46_11155, partial [Chitinophagales bacterium]